jgi:hypothetical protein
MKAYFLGLVVVFFAAFLLFGNSQSSVVYATCSGGCCVANCTVDCCTGACVCTVGEPPHEVCQSCSCNSSGVSSCKCSTS